MLVTGSRDAWKISGDAVGIALCARRNTRITIGYPNPENELVQLTSDDMLIVIPSYVIDVDRLEITHYRTVLNISRILPQAFPLWTTKSSPQIGSLKKSLQSLSMASESEWDSCSREHVDRSVQNAQLMQMHSIVLAEYLTSSPIMKSLCVQIPRILERSENPLQLRKF